MNLQSDKGLNNEQIEVGRRRGMIFWIAAAILIIVGGILLLIGAIQTGVGFIAFGIFSALWAVMYTFDF